MVSVTMEWWREGLIINSRDTGYTLHTGKTSENTVAFMVDVLTQIHISQPVMVNSKQLNLELRLLLNYGKQRLKINKKCM